jgi:hypothetical protein
MQLIFTSTHSRLIFVIEVYMNRLSPSLSLSLPTVAC